MFVLPPCYNAGDSIPIPFDTFASAGNSVTISGFAVTDIEIYKDASTTQRSSDNGYTLADTDGIDFDGTTGLQGFIIDTSDNSVAGFWADGHTYWININAITIDSQTVTFTFMLALGYTLRPATAGRKLVVDAAGLADANTVKVGPTGSGTAQTAGDIPARLPSALGANGNMKSDVRDYNGAAGTFASGRPEVNASHGGGTAWNSGAIGPNTLANDTITAAKLAADAGTEIGTAVWAATTRILTAGTNIGTVQAQLANGVTHGGTAALLSLQQIDMVSDFTIGGAVIADEIQISDFDIFNDIHVGNDVLVDNDLTVTGAVSGLFPANVVSMDTDSLTAAAVKADAVTKIQNGLSTLTAAGVWANATRLLTAGTNIALAKGTGITGFNDLDAAAVGAAVLDAATSGHVTAGTVCKAIIDALADTNELQVDWVNGGRLDLLIDAIKAKSDTIGDIYHADIHFTVDAANSQDEYTITWFKSGVRVTSGITLPTITVVKRADGTNLINAQALTQIGSTGSYKYDATTTARLTAGEAAVAVVSATIDGSTRTYSRIVGRDSAAP